MCGISGIVKKNTSLDLKEKIFAMSQSIKHRGPDGEGFLFASAHEIIPVSSKDTETKGTELNYVPKKNISEIGTEYFLALAHRRLAIIDLSDSGHQPMTDTSGKIWITYNGEIYNYLELKKELEGAGYKFISSSDTEVIINAYKEWGSDCMERFNGMWSFCIYDSEKNILFCSRDRFGVKPFYYLDNKDCFAFASEQKAFIKSGLVKAEMNEKALHDYLVNGRLESEENNFFKDVKELWPGYFLVYNLSKKEYTTHSYYELDPQYSHSTDLQSDEELIKLIREKLTYAVSIRMRSDVPVGSCLSGGIDSSALAVLMSEKMNDPVYFFTSVFRNEPIDESKFAAIIAKKVKGIHKTVEPTQEALFKELETLVYSQDVPIWDTSTYAQYKVMELAKQNNIKVVLDGQGADELFAGYHHHFVAKWNYLFGYGNIPAMISDMNHSRKSISHPFSIFAKERIKANYNSHLAGIKEYFDSSYINSYPVHNPTQYLDNVNEQLANDMTKARLKSFLKCEDRCGMWHSVESRTPFSDDIELIQLMFSINGNRKIQKGISKFFLREALKDKLPAEIYSRYDKKGFETPMNKWIGKNYRMIFDSLYDPGFIKTGLLKKKFDEEKQEAKDIKFLFKLYVLSLWKKSYT